MLKYLICLGLSIGVLLAAPTNPSNLQLSALSAHSVSISWQDNSDNESGFKIYRDNRLIAITPSDTHNFTDSNLLPSTTYNYTVKATDDTATYVVDNTLGSDDNSGSIDAPFKSIQATLEHATAGSSIYIKAGTYYERVHVKHSGSADAPIMIEGELDKTGKRLVYVHGGDLVQAQWEVAEEIEGGLTYKTQDIPYESYAMTVNQNGISKDIPRLYETNENKRTYLDKDKNGTYTYKDILALDKDATVKTYYNGIDIQYWDGIEAVYTYVQKTKTTYLRFRNGDNPNTMQLYTAPGQHNPYGSNNIYDYDLKESAVFTLHNKSYITIANLNIDGAQNGILIYGPESRHNTVNNNEIINGQRRVSITQKASYNVIKNNTMHMNLLSSYRPGAWHGLKIDNLKDKDKLYKRAVSEHYYIAYKHEIGYDKFAPIDDCGVFLNGAGSMNNIHHNEIYDTLCGVAGSHLGDVYIHDNLMHHNSDIATAVFKRSQDTYIYRNRFYDNNTMCRIFLEMGENELEFLKKKVYLFQNISYNPKDTGSHFYFSREGKIDVIPPDDSYHPEVFIFHNTFVGGGRDGNIVQNVDSKIAIVNNIFHGVNITVTEVIDGHRKVGKFKHVAHNWFNAQHNYTNNNEVHEDQNLWNVPDIPTQMLNFSLPADSTATGKAIDITKPFTIDGTTYPAMPLIYSWYYKNHAPNIGALQ